MGDVRSLFGRIFRNCSVLIAVLAVFMTSELQAAPYAAIVMDARTGEILYEKNARTRLHPASLTKMMTLYIVFQEIEAGNLSLDTKVTISDYAASQPPSRLGLKPGQKIEVRYLIRAAAIKSANDAAAALGDAIGGDHVAFAKRMTATARELGMGNTTFKNANGLTAEGHLSTAYDMTLLGRHLFYDFPAYYGIFSRRTADAGVATVTSTNSRFLESYEGADGIKTGYTAPAGFNLTASAHRGGKHIIATIFGGDSSADRNAKMADLMDMGFEKAPDSASEVPPTPAPLMDDALIASIDEAIEDVDGEGGAGKTISVSGAVLSSPRPKARPVLPTVSDDVAIAMAEGIDGALDEATAEPAPEGTLEFQAEAIAAGEVPAEPAATELAETALAYADLTVATPPVSATLEAQAEALTETDPALEALKPKLRPDEAAPADPAAVLIASADPAAEAPELVMTDPGPDVTRAEAPELLMAQISGIESVAGKTKSELLAADLAPTTVAAPASKRKSPIFDTVEVADTPAEYTGEEVVVVLSTSGGRHFGVNVGEYPTEYEAERALLKTALAESATLNDGLRKATESNGIWRASFMGLTEDQADLACRRLTARAIPCETVGS